MTGQDNDELNKEAKAIEIPTDESEWSIFFALIATVKGKYLNDGKNHSGKIELYFKKQRSDRPTRL